MDAIQTLPIKVNVSIQPELPNLVWELVDDGTWYYSASFFTELAGTYGPVDYAVFVGYNNDIEIIKYNDGIEWVTLRTEFPNGTLILNQVRAFRLLGEVLERDGVFNA